MRLCTPAVACIVLLATGFTGTAKGDTIVDVFCRDASCDGTKLVTLILSDSYVFGNDLAEAGMFLGGSYLGYGLIVEAIETLTGFIRPGWDLSKFDSYGSLGYQFAMTTPTPNPVYIHSMGGPWPGYHGTASWCSGPACGEDSGHHYEVVVEDVLHSIAPAPVPEPGSWMMLAGGLAAIRFIRGQRL